VLQHWTFIEPLATLSEFKQRPGPEAFDKELVAHAEKLSTQAKAQVQTSTKDEGWQKLISTPILMLGQFGFEIPRAANAANSAMTEVLAATESKFGSQGMQELAVELRERDPALGNEIVSSSDAFATVMVADFNRKTTVDISKVKSLYAVKNGVDEAVWRKYDEFKREYDALLQQCTDELHPIADPLDFLVEHVQKTVGQDKASSSFGITWGYDSQQQVPRVLGGIFAWWSIDFLVKLRKRNPLLKADPEKLRRANNGQVVCILRLLGASMDTVSLRNHLAEVPTGEGKSVVIGVLATTLALYGFNVDCVCYSSMLSSRDCDDFMPMFTSFGLTDRIRYGTFDTLCEQLLTEQYGNLRESTREFIATGASSTRHQASEPKRVLVIDEVDVFCSQDFFGGAFSPVLTLKNDAVANLMMHIWSLRTASFDLPSIKAHPTYKAIMSSGILSPRNEWLLERAVRKMDEAARAYSPGMRTHIVENGKIKYKIDGRDEFGFWTYDYETNAEYLAEFERGGLNQHELREGLAVYVRCGEFSYAKLPKMFKHILGVTGTLDSEKLPPQMHDVLRTEVDVKLFTYCPSMYHSQMRDWKQDRYVQVASDVDEHYHMIVDEIESRLTATTEMEAQRSVLVFFRDAEEITKFFNSTYFANYKAKANVLTELTAARRENRDNIIKSATRQGMITLASRMYGRGTDFKIFDDRMEKAGGMHVLQTFFSRELSEEVQIMGRCARQGNKGSFSMVLLNQVDEFDVNISDEGWDSTEVYAQLAEKRTDAGAAEVRDLREMAVKRLQEHEILARSLRSFHNGQTKELDTLMRRYNSPGGMSVGPNGMHVIFCLDESGSMSGKPWQELDNAYQVFWNQSAGEAGPPMYVSVVQFGSGARIAYQMAPLQGAPPRLTPCWSGTCFYPAIQQAQSLITGGYGPDHGYTAVVIFMSDGHAGDVAPASQALRDMAQRHPSQFSSYTIGFGSGAPITLEQMAFANGEQDKNNYRAAAVGSLADAFAAVATSIAPGRL